MVSQVVLVSSAAFDVVLEPDLRGEAVCYAARDQKWSTVIQLLKEGPINERHRRDAIVLADEFGKTEIVIFLQQGRPRGLREILGEPNCSVPIPIRFRDDPEL